MSETSEQSGVDAIAIVGMSGRFPGARNVGEFWRNLRNGTESIKHFSEEELVAAGIDPEIVRPPNYVKARRVLDDADCFDAAFFRYTPREADVMDPQHRLLLECAWEALEHAGCNVEAYDGPVGVFAGTSINSYLLSYLDSPAMRSLAGLEFLVSAGNDFLATRISYKLNLKGPSFTVQTACSTSLVAVCQACQSLADYQCDMALAGGVSVHVPQQSGTFFFEGGVTSPDGHCRAFDSRAQGLVSGSGVGMVALKRLDDALREGDTIHAVIRGWAVNNDGSEKIGYTAPSIDGQAEVIAMAQTLAGVDPDTVSYVEAHGTGTPLGDPIEIAALTEAFSASTERTGYCAIGSVKTNVGHLDAAAGVTGLIKTALALENRELPPSLHFEEPNPKIDFANSPFYVNSALTEWKEGPTPCRAGVSSFGIGGTNAHVVLEEAPEPAAPDRDEVPGPHLLLLSARSPAALDRATDNLREFLKDRADNMLADVAYTLQAGRKRFSHRRMLLCSDVEEAVSALEKPDRAPVLSEARDEVERPVAFMFPGQGAQYVNMGRDLYEALPAFRREVDRCCELLAPELGFDLREVLYPDDSGAPEAETRLVQTAVTQPALFVIEYSLARQWMDWGVQPEVMIGHSIGEYVAACLAGVLSLEDALVLVAARGRLMQEVPAGSMLAVPMSPGELEPLLGDLDIALLNESEMCVVSGPTEAIERLEATLSERKVSCRRLQTSHAFHSAMMDPILGRFEEIVRRTTLRAPRIPYVSNVTGTWITEAETTDPGYWAQHLRRTIRFAEGLDELAGDGQRLLLEVGPGTTLGTLAALEPGRVTVSSMRHPRDRQPDQGPLLRALGRLWLGGVSIDWQGFHEGHRQRRIPLPGYPFERERHWIDAAGQAASARRPAALGRTADLADWFYVPSWKRSTPPAALASGSGGEAARWLLFADGCGLAERIAARLSRQGHTVLTVHPGAAFERAAPEEFTIAPADPEHYAALFSSLEEEGRLPDRIVHLWGVTGAEGLTSAELIDRCFYSPVQIAQTIGPRDSRPVTLALVSNGLHEVVGGETLQPEKAAALGPVGVIDREYPQIRCRSIDLDVAPGESGDRSERAAAALLAELLSTGPEDVVAYRGGHRWVRSFEPIRLETHEGPPARLRQRGVYLITGGLGGIGLALAGVLARTASARLVLVGRTALPGRGEWDEWLASHPADDVTATRIRAVSELEASGSEVLVAAADVADSEQMRAVLAQARERFGALHGVIHAAGVAGGGVIQLKTREAAEAVLAPKVRGTLVLHELLGDEPLDFLVLCSSLTAVTGGAGQVDYTAANAFLDAFAQSRRDGATISVNWDAWGEVGMAVDTEVPAQFAEQRRQQLAEAIRSDEGCEIFQRVLDCSLPQVLVSTTEFLARTAPPESDSVLGETETPATAHARPAMSTAYAPPRGELEQKLAEIWQGFFGMDQIGIDDNFFELGGHSLLAIRVVSRVNAELGVDIRPNTFFEVPTICLLAAEIERSRPQQEEDAAEVARVLEMVEGLSEEEVNRLLAEQEAGE
jgi:acyl transferase domain-containing protein/acyl carrier protein